MGRFFVCTLFVAGLLATAASAAEVPILAGPWASDQEGYGHAKPARIFNGGDGQGLVLHIHWSSWGGARAVGEGLGLWVRPHQISADGKRESARVVAFKLGYCRGRKAYNAVESYFPQHGQGFSPSEYIDACTGEYHLAPKAWPHAP